MRCKVDAGDTKASPYHRTDGGALDFAFLPGYAAFDPMITFEFRAAAKFPRIISSRSYVSFRRQ